MASDVQTPGGGYGQPCDVLREHVRLNSGSFSTVAGTTSDFFQDNALFTFEPIRPAHQIDTVAYAAGVPTETSWQHRVRGAKTQNGRLV